MSPVTGLPEKQFRTHRHSYRKSMDYAILSTESRTCIVYSRLGQHELHNILWWSWWSSSWLGQSNPVVWHPHSFILCVCDCSNESTGPRLSAVSVQMVTKRQLTDTVFPCTVAASK